jgi:hypothetical protein
MKCSSEGELYMRFARGTPEPGVSIVADDRKQIRRLSLASLPELNRSSLLDFCPGSNHSTSFLIGRRSNPRGPIEHDIVTWKNDGTAAITKIDIQPGVSLRQITALGSDTFVIAGYSMSDAKGAKPFMGIFDDRGQLQKEISLTGDLEPKEVARAKLMPGGDEPTDAFTGWLELSSLQTAEDGRAYLMRRSPEGPVFLISPGGTVQKLKLVPPEKSAVLASVKVRGGTIAAEYYVPNSSASRRVHYITLTNVGSGKVQYVIRYTGAGSTGVGMVCYGEKGFEFLAQDSEGYLAVITAIGR